MVQGRERRQTRRWKLTQPLHVAVETPDGPPIGGTVRDVSQLGVGLEVGAGPAFHPGDELILQVSAEPAHSFLATARVVWAQPGDDAQKVGLMWTHRGPNRQRLEALFESAAAATVLEG
jgi:hypothetical protein